jgi:hypothetical protein
MYHIKHIVNGRPRLTGYYEITDDNKLIVESSASEETMKYYESLNKEERKRKETDKVKTKLSNNANIRDIDKIRRIEDIGFYYEDGLKYSAKLFIYFDEETGREIESKCFYFLAGPFYWNQMEGIINRMTAQEFDNYLEYPRYARFRLVPAHIESI